ncbi:MAG: hypothetical protein E7593_03200 [Ruminococcaceae bacterium]|nr:hypothetical protein [Oscillospiraceae bacterium]
MRNEKLLGMLGLAARARKLIAGTEIVTEKIKAGRSVKLVLIASDVSENTLKKIVNCCEFYETEYERIQFTRDEISHAIGKMCLTSAVAIIDPDFYNAVKKLV